MANSATSRDELPKDDRNDIDATRADQVLRVPFFANLPSQVLQKIRPLLQFANYDEEQSVYSADDALGEDVLVVVQGQLRVSRVNPENGELSVSNFGSGSVLGLENLFADQSIRGARASAMAIDPVCLGYLNRAQFQKIALAHVSVMIRVVKALSNELIAARGEPNTPEISTDSAVFSVLLQMVGRDSITGVWRIEKMPKHRELAQKAGVDEEDAARAISKLVQEKIVRRNYPSLEILDISALHKFID